MDLVLVRHGESEWNRLGDVAGPDSPLTDLGRRQAQRAGRWLAQRFQFTAFYTSTLIRAQQTAEIINEYVNLPITCDDDLREAETNYLEAMPRRESPFAVDFERETGPFGPNYGVFLDRVSRVTRRIVDENPEGTVLVVAHGGTLATMLRVVLGIHTVSFWTENAAVHHLSWHDGRWSIHCLNSKEHLIDVEIMT